MSESAESESKRKFSEISLPGHVPERRQDADHDRPEAGREVARVDARERASGSAPAAAIESEVREPGRIVVCAEEIRR